MSIEKEIRETMKYCFDRGWITRRDGNISYRKDNSFYITPSSIDKTKPFTLVKGELIDGQLILDSSKTPSIELEMHKLVHEDRLSSKELAVVHIHPTYTIAAMRQAVNGDLSEKIKQFPELSRYTTYGGEVADFRPGSFELANGVRKALRGNNICGIYNHGVTSVDTSICTALEHIERLEHICQIIVLSER